VARGSGKAESPEYDVCLSFAGEDRGYVARVASRLRAMGLRTFYDEYEQASLWGKDLYEHLNDVYKNAARYCILFISKRYAKKLWTTHERKAAQARAFSENREYILPARFDDTPLPGLMPTVGYVDLRSFSAPQFAKLVFDKVGLPPREYYVPPVPDRLFKRLGLADKQSKEHALDQAEEFVESLRRMSDPEKNLVADMFIYGCPTDLPDNVHVSPDFLRRISGLPTSQSVRELRRIGSLGYELKVRKRRYGRLDPTISLSFYMRRAAYDGPVNATGTIDEMINCLQGEYCAHCVRAAVLRGDFSALATATRKPEGHARGRPAARREAR
jgi:hypothetical protein